MDYKDTVFLPKSSFGMRGGLPQREPEMIERWNKINLWGFSTNTLSKIIKNLDEVESQHKIIDSKRSSLDYDIDGIVYKVNDLRLQSRLGNTSNSPLESVHKWL